MHMNLPEVIQSCAACIHARNIDKTRPTCVASIKVYTKMNYVTGKAMPATSGNEEDCYEKRGDSAICGSFKHGLPV